jgi:respiratory burst oxidase
MERQAGNSNGGPPPEHKGADGKSASRRSTRFKEEKEYLEVTLDVRGDGDAVAIQSVVEMSEAALLPAPTPGPGGLSSRLKAELRRITSMTKPPQPAVRPRLDRSMTGARQALRGLHFLNQSVVTQGSWPEAEKRFDRLAVDGLLLRSRFGQCIGKLSHPQLARSCIYLNLNTLFVSNTTTTATFLKCIFLF